MELDGLDKSRLPQHVAIIMDGNGRWATQRHKHRIEGHRRGKTSVRVIVEMSRKIGIRYLSLYAFSTENWFRPDDEVEALMGLLEHYLVAEQAKMMRYGIRLLAVGDRNRLPAGVRRTLEKRHCSHGEKPAHDRRVGIQLQRPRRHRAYGKKFGAAGESRAVSTGGYR